MSTLENKISEQPTLFSLQLEIKALRQEMVILREIIQDLRSEINTVLESVAVMPEQRKIIN